MPQMTPFLAQRFGARAYTGQPIASEALTSILEAGRWAPSSMNDQPWRFIVAPRQDAAGFEAMLHCLAEPNQAWAKDASVLITFAAARNFSMRERPNLFSWHDVGLAVMAMSVQAVSLGLQSREMAGIDRDKLRSLYKIPEDYDILSTLAIGYPADNSDYHPKRERRPLDQMAFQGEWSQPWKP
jgi:nitroreductase